MLARPETRKVGEVDGASSRHLDRRIQVRRAGCATTPKEAKERAKVVVHAVVRSRACLLLSVCPFPPPCR